MVQCTAQVALLLFDVGTVLFSNKIFSIEISKSIEIFIEISMKISMDFEISMDSEISMDRDEKV